MIIPCNLKRIAAAALIGLSTISAAPAQISDLSQVVSVTLIEGWRQDDGVHVAGLRIALASGWKTYWRQAGAAGIAPQMDWRGSGNVRSVTPRWPVPQVFGEPGVLSIGYDSDVVVPLLVRTGQPGAAVALQGVIDLGVCQDVCLPARVAVSGTLTPGGAPVAALRAALRDQPRRMDASARCDLAPTPDGLRITGRVEVPRQGPRETVVFELPDPSAWVADATVRRQGATITAVSDVVAGGNAPLAVDRSRVRITVIGDGRAVEVMGCDG